MNQSKILLPSYLFICFIYIIVCFFIMFAHNFDLMLLFVHDNDDD